MMNFKDIQFQTPRAWKEFEEYFTHLLINTAAKPAGFSFLDLPFEMQFGVYVSFFKENGLDIDVPQWDIEVLKITILETFRLHENMMDHFS